MAIDTNQGLPYWKLSGFYFFYFASLGVMLPYWNPYLYERGFSAAEIGYLSAIIAFTKVLAPYLWGWLADHINNRMKVIQFACLACVLVFPLVMLVHSLFWMAIIVLAFSFFWNASLPQFEATTLSHLDKQAELYSSVRLWGSVGFIIAVLAAGYFLDYSGLDLQPVIMLGLFACIFFSSLFITNKTDNNINTEKSAFILQLKNKNIILLLVLCFLMQFSHGAYYTFYSIYLQSHGYSESLTGLLWALGTFSEIFVFIYMHRFIKKYKVSYLLIVCFVLTAIRWLVMGYAVNQLWLMVLVQLLHAFSFGMFHSTAIHMVHQHFAVCHQGKGQALYSASSFGLGGGIGALVSGYMWSISISATFLIMALAAFVGVFLSIMVNALNNKPVLVENNIT